MSQRTDQLDVLLRQEIAEIVTREVGDPRIGFVTITDVETSPDLRHAQVWASVIGQRAERDATIAASVGRCHSCGASLAGGSGSSASRTFTFASTTPRSAAPVSSSSCTSWKKACGDGEPNVPSGESLPTPVARLPHEGDLPDEPPSAVVPPAPTARRCRGDRQRSRRPGRNTDERRPRRVPRGGSERAHQTAAQRATGAGRRA